MKRAILAAVAALLLTASTVLAAPPALSFSLSYIWGPVHPGFDQDVQLLAEPSRNGNIKEYVYAFRFTCFAADDSVVSEVNKWVDFHGANSVGEAWFTPIADHCEGVVTVGYDGTVEVSNTVSVP